jgi:hypothetical protein
MINVLREERGRTVTGVAARRAKGMLMLVFGVC